jgi:hypothetical protein
VESHWSDAKVRLVSLHVYQISSIFTACSLRLVSSLDLSEITIVAFEVSIICQEVIE